MESSHFPSMLRLLETPHMERSRMIIGFSGWMDGGNVSTGSLDFLIGKLHAKQVAILDANDFYLFNFPGPMDINSTFRPHVVLRQGLLVQYNEPQNYFFADDHHGLLFFVGREPNIHWHEYAQCLMTMARAYHVYEIYFVGSVAGLTPHTREPRLSATVSHEGLRPRLEKLNIKFSDYEGPGSFVNLLLRYAQQRSIDMYSLVAEIPPYIEGRNPKCIEAMIRRLSILAEFEIELSSLRERGDLFEQKVNNIVENNPELQQNIKLLEENYDQEVFDTEMGDLKNWLQQQGIRLD